MKFSNEWDFLTKRSILYMFFIHHVISGKYEYKENKWNESYFLEKKALRSIAVLKVIYGNKLYDNKLKDYLTTHFDIELDPSKLENIITTYFYLPLRQEGRIVDFMHETFKEYLLAEYIIEILLYKTKIHRLNIGSPSIETINFLDGLLRLFNIKDQYIIKKFIETNEENQITLLNSFNYKEGINKAIKDICESAINTLNEDGVVFKNSNPYFDPNSKDVIWFKSSIANTDYDNLYIHKSLCLRVILTLNENNDIGIDTINRENLSHIFTSNSGLLNDLVMNTIDLSKCDFKFIHFYNIRFVKVNLRHSFFSNVTFQMCTFENCIIDNCIFIYSIFSSCRFINTNINQKVGPGSFYIRGYKDPLNFLFSYFLDCEFNNSNIASLLANVPFDAFQFSNT